MQLGDPELARFAEQLAAATGVSFDVAMDRIAAWQRDREGVEDKLVEQDNEMASTLAQKRRALCPIWRCSVCGRADKPYIACYVAPYVVGYEMFDMPLFLPLR